MTTGPVFIVGAPRSGTSILYRTLLKHPSFAVEGDEALQLAESAILDTLHSAPRWKRPRPPRLWLYFLQNPVAYDAFLADVQAATAEAKPSQEGGRPPWTESVLAAFVRHAVATRRCRRLLEKTPSHIDRAEWILDSLPEAQLLFIHRHPVDTYASYRRRAEVDPKATWAALSVDEFAEIYVRQEDKAQRLAAEAPDRFRAIGYEQFTGSPEMVMADVCDFLGELFLPEIVEEPNPDLSRARHDPHLYGRITPQTKNTNDYVDAATAHEVIQRTADTARAWGYAFG